MMVLGSRVVWLGAVCMLSGILIARIFDPLRLDSFVPVSLKAALPLRESSTDRMNATFVTLARNSDAYGLAKSIRSVEDRFNRHHHYDWVFLNDVPFEEEFINVTSSVASGKTFYGLVPKEHWSYPSWINQTRAAEVRKEAADVYMYGDSESYRHMCRFFSGFFFRHELLSKYEWYWRVEPDTELWCDIDFDPFRLMQEQGKKYSFVISMIEFAATVPTLWDAVKEFFQEKPELLAEGNSLGFLSDDEGESYNLCHFWSNFEIANLDWLRSPQYLEFFDHLDKRGGFFYERWGDAPVHSIAAGLLLKKEEIHFFNEIAYSHPPYGHCPTGEPLKRDLKCHCDRRANFDWHESLSCLPKFFDLHGLPMPSGYEEELPLAREGVETVTQWWAAEDAKKEKLEMCDSKMAEADLLVAKAKFAIAKAKASRTLTNGPSWPARGPQRGRRARDRLGHFRDAPPRLLREDSWNYPTQEGFRGDL